MNILNVLSCANIKFFFFYAARTHHLQNLLTQLRNDLQNTTTRSYKTFGELSYTIA